MQSRNGGSIAILYGLYIEEEWGADTMERCNGGRSVIFDTACFSQWRSRSKTGFRADMKEAL